MPGKRTTPPRPALAAQAVPEPENIGVAVPRKRRTPPRPALAAQAAVVAPPSHKRKPEPEKKNNKRPLQEALPDLSMSPPKKASKASKNSQKKARVQEAGDGEQKRKAKPANGFAFPDGDVAFSDIPVADELHAELANLGASKPVRVYRKLLSSSDMCAGQSRLLISCKNSRQCPFAEVFKPAEKPLLHDKSNGLQMTAYDNVGRSYNLKCKFLHSNKAYRLIEGWCSFLKTHHLDTNQFQDVLIEVWAFRSGKLERGLAGQDCGKLGLVLVPYFGSGGPDPGIGARNPEPGNAIVPDVEGASEEGDSKGAQGEDEEGDGQGAQGADEEGDGKGAQGEDEEGDGQGAQREGEEGDGKGAQGEEASREEEVAPAVDAVMVASAAPEVVTAETAWKNYGLSPIELEAAVVLMLLKLSRADADGVERSMH